MVSVQSFIQHIIASLGLKRKLTALFQVLSTLVLTVPSLVIFAPVLQGIASWLGIVAVGHSAVAGTLGKNILSTVAALFSALLIAVDSVPELQPYAGVIRTIATILGFFTSVKATVGSAF